MKGYIYVCKVKEQKNYIVPRCLSEFGVGKLNAFDKLINF